MVVAGWLCLGLLPAATAEAWISTQPKPGAVALAQGGHCADILYAPEDFKVVSIAASALAQDIEVVTRSQPKLLTKPPDRGDAIIFVGTLGHSPIIATLLAAGKIDVSSLRGQWESFLIITVSNPAPGIASGLVIVGSDRRGTAFGVFELSQAIGVSPWHWWADVVPEKRSALYVLAGTHRYGPPSVKYRGIFLNDEDWGLQPWAAKTFDPELGDIGPKTYGKVFELLLRLKANTLWPAMHACTKPFNSYLENKHVADDYAIVMGSSHAEPMLRNNVGEWNDPPEKFNYASNREGVLHYWEQRLQENGRYENIYTIGMRGIHDSAMQGPQSARDRIKLLEQIFADQRDLIAKHVQREVEAVPQVFCAYKEVLDLYRGGLNVPEDVTIMFPDDNFGYIRDFATPAEQNRPGGFGIYYHISYLGRPLSYLWLCTTPPALIWEEMNKAYEHGANRIWIVNVGDLKPAELSTEFFLQMAWDVQRWRSGNLPEFYLQWARREFGAEHASEVAAIMQQYFLLNFQRKPEHLQWWLPNQPPRPSPFTDEERKQRLKAFAELKSRVEALGDKIVRDKRDAFFELVQYPVGGSALANERYFRGEMAALATDQTEAHELAGRATAADQQLKDLTRIFNEDLAGGKWRGILQLEPADRQWRSMRVAAWEAPQFPVVNPATSTNQKAMVTNQPESAPSGLTERAGVVAINAGDFTRRMSRAGAQWQRVTGLGRTGDAVTILPTTMPAVPREAAVVDAPVLEYEMNFAKAGDFPVQLFLLPTQAILPGGRQRIAIGCDEQRPQEVVIKCPDSGADWSQGVLDATRVVESKVMIPSPGKHVIRVYGLEAGVVFDKIVMDWGHSFPLNHR